MYSNESLSQKFLVYLRMDRFEKKFLEHRIFLLVMVLVGLMFAILNLVQGDYPSFIGFGVFSAVAGIYWLEMGDYEHECEERREIQQQFLDSVRREEDLNKSIDELSDIAQCALDQADKLLEDKSKASQAFVDCLSLLTKEQMDSLPEDTKKYIDDMCQDVSDSKCTV